MTQDEIIEMARQAGFHEHDFPFKKFKFEAFAKLVAAKEREACAKVCEDKNTLLAWPTYAAAIRARSISRGEA